MSRVTAYTDYVFEAVIDHCDQHWQSDPAGAVATGLAGLYGLNEHQGRLARIVERAGPVQIAAPRPRRMRDHDGSEISLCLDTPDWLAEAAALVAGQSPSQYLLPRRDGIPLTALEYRHLVRNVGARAVGIEITPTALARTMSMTAAEEGHWAILLDIGYHPGTAIARLVAQRLVKLPRRCDR